jgi:hypothetical protein
VESDLSVAPERPARPLNLTLLEISDSLRFADNDKRESQVSKDPNNEHSVLEGGTLLEDMALGDILQILS